MIVGGHGQSAANRQADNPTFKVSYSSNQKTAQLSQLDHPGVLRCSNDH